MPSEYLPSPTSHGQEKGRRFHMTTSNRFGNGKFWTDSRRFRLLEWLEKHPLESRIIYTKKTDWVRRLPAAQRHNYEGRFLTKTECHNRAVEDIFSVDHDTHVRKQLYIPKELNKLRRRVKDEISRSVFLFSFFFIV